MNKTINTKKLAKILNERQYGTIDEVECYCSGCEKFAVLKNVDVDCPYDDPYCYHDGWKCQTCAAEYEGVVTKDIDNLVEYNKERSIATKNNYEWKNREQRKEEAVLPYGFSKCRYCNQVTNQMGGRCSNCYL